LPACMFYHRFVLTLSGGREPAETWSNDGPDSLNRFPVEMNRDDRVRAVYPPHPEEGVSTCVSEKRNRSVAPVSKDGAAPWFETPRTSLRNRGRPKIAAPHHEAERNRVCIKLTGNRFRGRSALACEETAAPRER
jgi:hypothetical protein